MALFKLETVNLGDLGVCDMSDIEEEHEEIEDINEQEEIGDLNEFETVIDKNFGISMLLKIKKKALVIYSKCYKNTKM